MSRKPVIRLSSDGPQGAGLTFRGNCDAENVIAADVALHQVQTDGRNRTVFVQGTVAIEMAR